ncbi:hypothetical protein J4E83_005259 [Alternaria metachromatica]|uniref:uncharacterized protein n=1 Tax=Alternaria metachromatica TaxID=283354 RepID=UPI0020C4D800|nr:uncharacterized protein J4E83_005259 [Alternaria metachromatica]KAI4620896.1 hypothetical protein J4E83_005259 [Alternaria metachromatica]
MATAKPSSLPSNACPEPPRKPCPESVLVAVAGDESIADNYSKNPKHDRPKFPSGDTTDGIQQCTSQSEEVMEACSENNSAGDAKSHDEEAEEVTEELGEEGHEQESDNDVIFEAPMDHVNRAIQAATEVGKENEPCFDLSKGVIRHISARFGDSAVYVIPWIACYSWEVVLVLLKTYYRNDHDALNDLNWNNINILKLDHGLISSETWDSVVQHGMQVVFSVHSSLVPQQPPLDYRDQLRYTVTYLEVSPKDRDGCFVDERTYDAPMEVETIHGDTAMPALEELRTIQTPRYRANEKDADAQARAKLGPLDQVKEISLKINSSYLLNILKSVIEYASESPHGEEFGVGMGEFNYPFKDLYHHMDDLIRYRAGESYLRAQHPAAFNERADCHIDLILNYLSLQRDIPFEKYASARREKVSVTTFASCWLLLKPGTDVYVREEDGLMNAYIVHAVSGGVTQVDGKAINRDYEVSVWNLACDGTHAFPEVRHVRVAVFDNEREAKSLPVFPVEYNDNFDDGKLKQELTERGKRYLKYTSQPSFLQDSGRGLAKGVEPKSPDLISDHQYMLMASHVYAFMLKERTYDLLAVEGLEEPELVETAIDRLVIDHNNKELIKAMAQVYTDSDPDRFSGDFIRGKGEGQIILLHGPPGTGKTLTAETVAEYTRRPLLSITAADLGHEPEALERSLLRFFKDASDWGAIVLLDEADVYLEQRTIHDLKRNSIVSGKLFTSVKLRDDHERGGREILYEYDAKSYVKSREVQELEWNGREIRNAFQTAVALAVFEAKKDKNGKPPKVTEGRLRQVVQMSSAFRKYMTAAHNGMDESTWAFRHGNREDKFPSTPAKTAT